MAFLGRRLFYSFFSLLGLLVLVFFFARLTGDPTDIYLPLEADEEMRANFREAHGFDDSIIIQLGAYFRGLLTLDMGDSLWLKRPALPLVLERLPATLILAFTCMALSILFAIVLGILAAINSNSRLDRGIQVITLFGASVPDFWLGLVLILVFSVSLGLLPTSGTGGPLHLVLPVLTLMARPLGVLTQLVRTTMQEQLGAEYVRTAYAKGFGVWAVQFKHALKNALIPVVTVAGDQLAHLVNGAVVIETVFGWPGIGKLSIDAIQQRDFAVLQAAILVIALLIFAINFLLDVLYTVIDPRIRVG